MNTRAWSIAFLLSGLLAASAQEHRVIVEAGPHSYRHAITTFTAPESFPRHGVLRAGKVSIPFQKNPAGQVAFILPELHSEQWIEFEVSSSTQEPQIRAELEDGTIQLLANEKPLLTYQGQPSDLPRSDIPSQFRRGGYIHPVYTPSGQVVTDDYPPNHIHHHGIWFPWTSTRFEDRTPDFWNMGQKKGTVQFEDFGKTWSGPVHAGFTAHHRFVDLTAPEPKTALNESWQVTAYRLPAGEGSFHVFDLVSTQECATASPLVLPKYHYGGLGFRGSRAWDGAPNCQFLTSSGETDRVKGNETRGRWCHIGGKLEEGLAGIAILCHPENFRAPQPMRLHPTEPFFCFAPSQLGEWQITPGEPYISRYRFIVQDGPPDAGELDRQWQQYAQPPAARVLSN